MKNEEQFENAIRIALIKEVEPLAPSSDALKRINERINRGNGLTKDVFKQELINYRYVLNFHKTAAVFVCILVFAGLILAFSKPARVLAEEGIKKVFGMIYVVVKDEKGRYDTTPVPMDLSNISPITGEPTYLDDDELTREVGFNTKTPEELDNGYILWETSIYEVENPPQKTIVKTYYRGSKRFILILAGFEVPFSQFDRINYIDRREQIKVQDVLVKFLEVHSPIFQVKENGDSYLEDIMEKPIGVKTSYRTTWQYKGVYYGMYGLKVSLEEHREATVSLVKELQQ